MGLREHFKIEAGCVTDRRYISVILVFLLVSVYFIQFGISGYKDVLKEKENFISLEKKKDERVLYVPQIGFYGKKILFVPSPMIAFFDSGPVSYQMIGYIDSSERVLIYKSLRGQNAFSSFKSLFSNLSGFLLLFGSALALLYGFIGSSNHKWLLFIDSGINSRLKLFFYIITAKASFLFIVMLTIAGMSMLMFMINGVEVLVGNILIYFLVAILFLFCFLFIGFIAGAFKNRFFGGVAAVCTWLLLSFLLPVLLCHWMHARASSIDSISQIDADKQELFMDYEKDALEKLGEYDESKSKGSAEERELFLHFWDGGFKKVISYDKKMISEVEAQGVFFQNVAGFFPSTFFLSVSNEIGSGGFTNLVAFQEYTLKLKKNFIWFIASIDILGTIKDLPPFIKGSENVFEGKSSLPGNVSFGLTVLILWLIGLLIGFWVVFNRLLDHPSDPVPEKLQLESWKANKTTAFITSNPDFPDQLCRILGTREIPYIIVPNPSDLPSVKVNDLFKFFSVPVPDELQQYAKSFPKSIDADKKALIILDIISGLDCEFLVFDNFSMGLSDDGIDELIEKLHLLKKGRTVAYFTRSRNAAADFSDFFINGEEKTKRSSQ